MLALERRVLLRQDPGELAAERGPVEQVLHADADSPGPIGVRRSDTAARGADGRLRQARLHRSVERDVVRHDHVGVLADADPIHLDAARGEHLQFGDQRGRVDHHAVADDRRDVRDTARRTGPGGA